VELLGDTTQPSTGAPARVLNADDWAALFIEKRSAITDHDCTGGVE
jgi:hypothetical protein